MAIPLNALLVEKQMDPADIVDFLVKFYDTSDPDLVPILEAGETISSYTIDMSSEGTALGVTIESVAPRAPALTDGSTSVLFWLSVSGAFLADPAWDGEGTPIPVILTVDTNQNRRYQRTTVVQVAQQ